jgi:hypothetical protein
MAHIWRIASAARGLAGIRAIIDVDARIIRTNLSGSAISIITTPVGIVYY